MFRVTSSSTAAESAEGNRLAWSARGLPPRPQPVTPAKNPSPQIVDPLVAQRDPVVHGVVRAHTVAGIRTLRARLAESWTLSALAEEVHLSRSQLVRAFNATVGLSPMAYLRQMRVERMARLLTSTDLSVAEAARAVGWSDQFYASRTFHAHYGVSPRKYRHRQAPPPLDK